ncbi:SpoIIE family protein phosphatase [Desulfovibrio ferrophilus]|uniref:Protein serine/threonine phosphatase n=1 Tax=Desulfovibrio ferrophilus TaxID=241368 RepID=A0A2Z6AYK8_9BACT|nr:SpoIIE family protein phosphatase [Desulfovibrio ferrophilus]BBD08255.1 protein serine/threonine phosphatase [Desulfovibrio ferrophilus]
MRFTLYKKLAVLVGGTLLFVAAAVLFFAGRDVERTVFDSELKGAENIMRLVDLNLEGRFKSYLMWKVSMVSSRKQQLEQESTILLSGLDRILGAKQSKKSVKSALLWLTGVSRNPDRLVFVYDKKGKMLGVNIADFAKADLLQMKDFKGRAVMTAMRDESMRYGNSFTTFRWGQATRTRSGRYLGMFSYYPRLGWIVGVCESLDSMTTEVRQRQEEILQGLRETIPDVRVARSGPVFLFSGDGELLVEPSRPLMDLMGKEASNEKDFLIELAKKASWASDEGNEGSQIIDSGPDAPSQIFVSHFRPMDWFVAAVAPKAELRAPAALLVERLSVVLACALVLGLALALIMARRIVRPIKALTAHVKDVPERDWTTENAGEIEVLGKMAERRSDEVGALAEAFVYMDSELRRNIRELIKTEAEKHRIESELGVARDIQMGLLPKIFPAFPERDELDLYAVLEPAREVGGDLYDFFFVDDGTVCVVVGDVSDKGVPAALFMTIAKTLIKNEALLGRPPEEILRRVNDDLGRDNPSAMFVTTFVGLLDVASGDLAFASGGHNPPLIIPTSGEITYLREVSGPMVGAMAGMSFVGLSAKLNVGDMLLVYTDGVTEAMNESKEMLTEDGLFEVVTRLRDEDAKGMVDGIVQAVHAHADGAPQSDDITVLGVRLSEYSSKDTRGDS